MTFICLSLGEFPACFTLAGDLLSHTRLFITICPWLSVLLFVTQGCPVLSQLQASAKPGPRGRACAGKDSRACRPQRTLWGHRLKLGRVTSSYTLGALWLGTECWRESVYSQGQALPVAGASHVCDLLSVLLGLTLCDHTMAGEPTLNSSGHILMPGAFLSSLGSQDALAGVEGGG